MPSASFSTVGHCATVCNGGLCEENDILARAMGHQVTHERNVMWKPISLLQFLSEFFTLD